MGSNLSASLPLLPISMLIFLYTLSCVKYVLPGLRSFSERDCFICTCSFCVSMGKDWLFLLHHLDPVLWCNCRCFLSFSYNDFFSACHGQVLSIHSNLLLEPSCTGEAKKITSAFPRLTYSQGSEYFRFYTFGTLV